MVELNRIITRTGDEGTTGLADGGRVAKYSPRIQLLGSLDEMNAALGLAAASVAVELQVILHGLQQQLFELGADLAREAVPDVTRLQETHVQALEAEAERWNASLPALHSFILPGGRPGAAALHLTRGICRRAERDFWALAESAAVPAVAGRYLNRLSDLLFILARQANDRGQEDVLWLPQAKPAA